MRSASSIHSTHPVLAGGYDNTRYTVMSYTVAEPAFSIGFAVNGNTISTTSQRVIVTTPMVLDIAAVQSIYGADPNTASGDTVYHFTQGDTLIKAIYDAGGTDTFDLANFTRPVLLDLNPGGYSSIGYFSKAAQIAYWQGLYPQFGSFIQQVLNDQESHGALYTWQDNLGIAFSTVIENAFGGSAADVIQGNSANNTLKGNGGADILIGGAGNDTLDGGTGADNLYGGTGNDSFTVDSASDIVFESNGEGTDTVTSSANYYLYGNIETLTLAAGAGGIFGVGNELANTITGNEGANTLLAGAGDDIVHGGAGVDIIYGQDGVDQLFGDADNDVIVGGIGNDVIDGGLGGDSLYGEDGNDTITGGTDFVFDQLVGGGGDDVLHGDSGQGDFDYLIGNAGNDSFYVDTYADLVFENAGEGIDTVYANIMGNGYYLYENIENLVLVGTTPYGVGNEIANSLTGNASANYLLGGGGNDTLNGKAGNDVLFGEAGADTFVFEHGMGGDTIGDFAAGTDRINLAAFGFTSFAQVQAAMSETGGSTAIILGSGDFIVLQGVANSALHAGDFILSGSASAAEPLVEATREYLPTRLGLVSDTGDAHLAPLGGLIDYDLAA
jgi:Ca2+-binding RTX toxin-like protein